MDSSASLEGAAGVCAGGIVRILDTCNMFTERLKNVEDQVCQRLQQLEATGSSLRPLMLANVLCPSVVCPVQWPLPLCSKLTRPLERVEEPSLCLLTWRLCLKLPTVSPSCDFPTRFPDHGAHCGLIANGCKWA